MRSARWLHGPAGALLAAAALAGGARAGEPSPVELATAREMFDEARRLEERGQWVEALQTFQAVGVVRMTSQVRFHIAACEEQLGRLVAALNDFERARAEAQAQGVAEVVEEAGQHMSALRPRLARLVFVLPPDVREPVVTVDGEPLAAALLRVPVPLDPGDHVVRVQARGRAAFARTVRVRERERQILEVALPPGYGAAAWDLPPPSPAGSPSTGSARATWGWVLVGTGVAALGGAAYAATRASAALGDLGDACSGPSGACEPGARDHAARASRWATWTTVLGAAGVVAGTGGLVLVATARSAPRTAVAVGPAGSGRDVGVVVSGGF